MTSLLKNYASFTSHTKPTVGDLKMSAVTVDHLGWLLCDGRPLLVSEWRFLFNIIGYQFGGSGNTFWLPDARGRVAGAVNDVAPISAPLSERNLGTTVGTETETLTIPQLPSHSHTITDVQHSHTGTTNVAGEHTHTQTTVNDDFNNSAVGDNGGYPDFSQPSYPRYDSAGSVTWTNTINSAGNHTHAFTTNASLTGITITNSTGDNQPINNMQPTIFLGNQFIYSGKPTYGTWPLTYSPPSLGPYGGQTQIQ